MVESRQSSGRPPVPVEFAPSQAHRALPVEVVERSSLLARKSAQDLALRQRVGFNLLMVCTAGQGMHSVDFEAVELSPGTCLRIHPGQVQQFVPEPAFAAQMVLWPIEADLIDPAAAAWFPGCGATTSWELEPRLFARVSSAVDELRDEQRRFDGSPRRAALMQALLHTLLLRLALEVPGSVPDPSQLPVPYLDFRRRVEECLHERPTIRALARDLGYSSRTLDRACQEATGQTAKQVLDTRLALEIRRLLTHTDRPLARIAADFAFDDPSNFSKFVRRHLGAVPGEVRSSA